MAERDTRRLALPYSTAKGHELEVETKDAVAGFGVLHS